MYKNLKNFYDNVIEWNKVAGNPGNKEKQIMLIREEEKELLEELPTEDVFAIAKEVADCLVVHLYFVHLQGGCTKDQLTLDFFEWRDAKEVASMLSTPCFFDLAKREECVEDSLFTVNVLAIFGYSLNVDFDLVLDSVIASNFSKFSRYNEADEEKYDEWCVTLGKDGRYKDVTWVKEKDYVVFRSGCGKVLKGPDFVEVVHG